MAYEFEVSEMCKGLYRVALYDSETNQMLNRRRDVAKGRVEEIKATLIDEVARMEVV